MIMFTACLVILCTQLLQTIILSVFYLHYLFFVQPLRLKLFIVNVWEHIIKYNIMYPFPNHYIRIYNVMVSYFIPNQTTAYLPRIEWANDF